MIQDLIPAFSEGDMISVVIIIFSYLVILLIAFPIHECAHAFAAKLLGDTTAEECGRVTLNPLAHLDPVGTFAILVFGIGWAKPVPVTPYRARKVSQRAAMALTAGAGPVSNILIALVFMIIGKIIAVATGFTSEMSLWLYLATSMIVDINLGLAVFNLIPVPPLDGSKLFLSFLPNKIYFKVTEHGQHLMIILLIAIGTGILNKPLSVLSDLIYSGLDFITGFIC